MIPEAVFSILSGSKELSFSPGEGEYDFATCSALCAGIKDKYLNAAFLKYAQDWSKCNDLEYALWLEACDIANGEGWHIPRNKEFLRKLAGLAIAETGSPRHFRAEEVKALWMEMDVKMWKRRRKQYELIYRHFNDWCGIAYETVANRLRLAS